MKDILQNINDIEGVIGCALFSEKGNVLTHAFPAVISSDSLKSAASLILECSHGLQIAQTLDLLDFRYSDGRILVKTFPGAMLFLLCSNRLNLQALLIILNQAVKKLEGKLTDALPAPAPPEQSAAEETESDSCLLMMKISHLANKQASASFDSLGMVALSLPTSNYISNYYKVPFKKLALINTAAGTNGIFPVMVMKDMDQQYDGAIIVGPGIEKKLRVSEGDKVEVRIG